MKHAETRMIQAFFASTSNHIVKILCDENLNASSGLTQRLRQSKIGINFFLDFDFQPLYTFINCGFLLRTAHP